MCEQWKRIEKHPFPSLLDKKSLTVRPSITRWESDQSYAIRESLWFWFFLPPKASDIYRIGQSVPKWILFSCKSGILMTSNRPVRTGRRWKHIFELVKLVPENYHQIWVIYRVKCCWVFGTLLWKRNFLLVDQDLRLDPKTSWWISVKFGKNKTFHAHEIKFHTVTEYHGSKMQRPKELLIFFLRRHTTLSLSKFGAAQTCGS